MNRKRLSESACFEFLHASFWNWVYCAFSMEWRMRVWADCTSFTLDKDKVILDVAVTA